MSGAKIGEAALIPWQRKKGNSRPAIAR